jgi:hypothetical protein
LRFFALKRTNQYSGLREKFPTQANREFFRRNREFVFTDPCQNRDLPQVSGEGPMRDRALIALHAEDFFVVAGWLTV